MKKLTKHVQAGGLWFDVPLDTTHIAADETGSVFAYTDEPTKKGYYWDSDTSSATEICYIELEEADWRECCWYVGDQVDGEAVERRGWMARGVDVVASATETLGAGDALLNKVSSIIYQICVKVSEKIRAGEVE